jgi:hypothetical protein
VRQGISTHTAMKLSGHKTESVFRRYDIISDEDLRDAAATLDRASTKASNALVSHVATRMLPLAARSNG